MSYRAWGSTIIATSATAADNPRVAGIGQDRFAYVWQDSAQDGGDTSGTAIRMKVYDPFGVALTASLLVNTTLVGSQANPQVLGLAGGDFVVVWQDNSGAGADTSGLAVRGQLFDANGAKLGAEFVANTTVAGSQSAPMLARNGSGFVVAWIDGSAGDDDVRAQRFDAAGAKVGGEILAGGSTAGNQSAVSIADTANGFALSWSSDDDANGSIDGVHVQVYTAAGVPRGGETTITASTHSLGFAGSARIDAAGNFAVQYTQSVPSSVETETRTRIFDRNGGVVDDRTSGTTQVMIGAFGSGAALAPWETVTLEPAAFASALVDGITGRGFVTVSAVRADGGVESDTVRETQNNTTPTVRDAAMLQDGRIVIANRESGGSLSFTIADGRGPNFGAFYNDGPTVLVGADAGPDMNNVITGSVFADTIHGLGGNDYLYGFTGNDVLVGGLGSDVLLGHDSNDTLYGGDGDDYLYGGTGTNLYVGDGGVDVLIGDTGAVADTMYGGDGGDYFYAYGGGTSQAFGEAGNDIFVMQWGPGRAYGGDGQDYFYMGAHADLMAGDAGVDVLQGGGGTDTYDGGAGTDYLFLGTGSDTVLVNPQSGVDVVNDFNTTQDFVRLQGTGITSYAQLLAATTDYGSFSVITIDANTAMWLVGVAPSQFTPNNFQFS